MNQLEEEYDYSVYSENFIKLGDGNPGAYTVVSKIFDFIENNHIEKYKAQQFIQKLLLKNIVGVRLWYIYKNEAKLNINNLLELNLDNFTDKYFYEKIEKYKTYF